MSNALNLDRNLAHRTASVFPAALVLAVAVLLTPGVADADPEQLYVLGAGGVDELPVVTVDEHADPPIAHDGAFELNADDGPLAYSDLVVLPDGRLLAADAGGRGGLFFDEEGTAVDELFEPGTEDPPASLVVSRFADIDLVTEVLIADATGSHIRRYDLIEEDVTATEELAQAGTSAEIARATALVDDGVAAAVSWPIEGFSTVEVLDPDDGTFTTVATSEATDNGDNDSAEVIETLHPLRNLMADVDGRLLVTSRDRVHLLDANGELLFDYGVGDDTAMGGQLETAHLLESGLIVAATRQPGLWNEPHTNHRLHLIDPDADPPYLGSSPSLRRAPIQLDVTDGHGATGTRGWYAGALDSEAAAPSDLTVIEPPQITPTQIALDGEVLLTFQLLNDTDVPLPIAAARMRAAPAPADGCDDITVGENDTAWWHADDPPTLAAGNEFAVNTPAAVEQLSVGFWCTRLHITGSDGSHHFFGDPIHLTITEPENGPSAPESHDDAGHVADTGDTGGFGDDPDDDNGCGCTTSGGAVPSLVALLFVVALRRVER